MPPTFVTTDVIVREVASGSYEQRYGITIHKVRSIWSNLCEFVGASLKHGKGVRIPNLGTFQVGHPLHAGCVDPTEELAPNFTLISHFDAVSQERGKWYPTGNTSVVQLNYQRLSYNTGVHRVAVQRVVRDLVSAIGVHILYGRTLKIDWDKLGQMRTKRKRFEFVFTSDLLSPAGYPSPLKHPLDSSDPACNLSFRDRRSEGGQAPMSFHAQVPPLKTEGLPQQVARLLQMCRKEDRVGTGSVPRLAVERILREQCRGLVTHMGGATMLDLLQAHTHGATGTMIRYIGLTQALKELAPLELEHSKIQDEEEAREARNCQYDGEDSPRESEEFHPREEAPDKQEPDGGFLGGADNYSAPNLRISTKPAPQRSLDFQEPVRYSKANESVGIVPGLPQGPGPVPQARACYSPLSKAESRRQVEEYNQSLKEHRRSLGSLPTGKVTSQFPTGDASSRRYHAWAADTDTSEEPKTPPAGTRGGDQGWGIGDEGGPLSRGVARDLPEGSPPPSPPDRRGRQGRSKSPIRWSPRRQVDEYNVDVTKPRKLIGGKLRKVEEVTGKVTQNFLVGAPGYYPTSPRRQHEDPEVELERQRLESLAADVAHKKEVAKQKNKEVQNDLRRSWNEAIQMRAEARQRQAEYSKCWPYGPSR